MQIAIICIGTYFILTELYLDDEIDILPLYFYCTGNEANLMSCRKGFITNCTDELSIDCKSTHD